MDLHSKTISKVTHRGRWIIDEDSNLYIECYVTNDARRLLSLKGARRTLELKGAGSTALSRNLQRDWIQPYLSEDLRQWIEKVDKGKIERVEGMTGKYIVPLDAELFVDICKAYVNAQKDGLFTDKNGKIIKRWDRQYYIADKLFKIMSAFAKIGIIGLIDEITGYQEIRDRHALQKILEMYIAKELRPWVKTFQDDFYENLFRLRGWQYRPLSVKRPIVVGRITNDLVYKRLAPKILDELKIRTPRDEKGRTKHRYFQWLTDDIGHPKLREHLASVTTLMKASPNWGIFYRLLQRALPQYGETLQLPFTDREIEKMDVIDGNQIQ